MELPATDDDRPVRSPRLPLSRVALLAILLAIHTLALPATTLHAAKPDITLDQAIMDAEAVFTTSCDPAQDPPIHPTRVLYKLDSPLGEMAIEQGLGRLFYQLNYRQQPLQPREDIVFSHMPKGIGFGYPRGPTAIITTYPLRDGTFTIDGKPYTLEDLKLLLTSKD